MTDTQGGEATAVDTTAADQAALSSQDTTTERDYETEARDMGWVPEDEFKGDKKPKKFLSAEEFVERGETIVPFLRKQLKDQEAKFTERLGKIEKVNSKTIEALTKQHEKDLADLKADKKAAVKAGDVDEVERLDAAIDKLKDDAPSTDKPLTGKALEKHNETVQKDWIKANPWYETDKKMSAYALGVSQQLAAENPNISIEDNLAAVEKAIREEYPDKFGGKTTSANGHALVDSGTLNSGPAPKDPLSKLPAEARAQAKSDMAKFPTVYPNVDAWLKVYNS